MQVLRCKVNEMQQVAQEQFVRGYITLAVSVDSEKDIRVIETVLEGTDNQAIWDAIEQDAVNCLTTPNSPAFVFCFPKDQQERIQELANKALEGDAKNNDRGYNNADFESTSDIVRLLTQPELKGNVAVVEEAATTKESVKHLIKHIVNTIREGGVYDKAVIVVAGFGIKKQMARLADVVSGEAYLFHTKKPEGIEEITNAIKTSLEENDRVVVIASSEVNTKPLEEVLEKVDHVVLKVTETEDN